MERLLLSGLHKPFAHAPLVLSHEHAVQLADPVGAVLERPEDRLAVRDREGEELAPEVVGVLEPFGSIGEAGLSPDPRKCRTSASATGMPASIIAPSVHLFALRYLISVAPIGGTPDSST